MVNNKRTAILNALQNSSDWLSGEQLSRQIGISRVAVWKHINILKEEGYPICSEHRGYRLTGVQDNLSSLDFSDDEKILFYRELESTMEEAGRKIRQTEGEKGDYIILTDHQNAGQSRNGGPWSSPEGGIYMTCVLNRPFPLSEASVIPLRGALAALKSLQNCGINGLSFHPPGEILLQGKKVGGILEDYRVRGGRILWFTLGIGIHINDAHPSGQDSIISISDITGEKILRKDLIRQFSSIWDETLNLNPNDVIAEIKEKWRKEDE